MATLVQVLLPAFDPSDHARRGTLDHVIGELNDRFGGVTAYTRSPATGLWQSEGDTVRDTVIMVEVVVEELDRVWWAQYRRALESRFTRIRFTSAPWMCSCSDRVRSARSCSPGGHAAGRDPR